MPNVPPSSTPNPASDSGTASPSARGTTAKSDRVISVSQLTNNVRLLIEKNYPLVWVTGEISNLARPGSGHWYFTLKDNKAQLRCAMFANKNRRLRFKPANGDQVVLRGNLSLYTGRGDFQMIVENMQAAGEGALRAAFDALREKLAAEGLFDEDRKQDFLEYPEHICIISSATGAALQDVLSVLERRYPIARVTLLPVLVQGPGSEADVLGALVDAEDLDADLIILTRGGGSLEDLWTFNLESVVRAVADCQIPTISAIGHETDITLTDFAADLRAPTPSVAAELATPDGAQILHALAGTEETLTLRMQQMLSHYKRALVATARIAAADATRRSARHPTATAYAHTTAPGQREANQSGAPTAAKRAQQTAGRTGRVTVCPAKPPVAEYANQRHCGKPTPGWGGTRSGCRESTGHAVPGLRDCDSWPCVCCTSMGRAGERRPDA